MTSIDENWAIAFRVWSRTLHWDEVQEIMDEDDTGLHEVEVLEKYFSEYIEDQGLTPKEWVAVYLVGEREKQRLGIACNVASAVMEQMKKGVVIEGADYE
jgi:hypothetical protein